MSFAGLDAGSLLGVLGSRVTSGLSGPLRSVAQSTAVIGAIRKAIGIDGNPGGFDTPQPNSNRHVLESMLSRGDPLLNFCWFCDMPNVGGVSVPWYYIEEAAIPFRAIEAIPVYRRGKMYNYAGHNSIANITFKMYEDNTGKAGAFVEAWLELVTGRDGIYNLPSVYKKDVEIVILDISRKIAVYRIKFKGCFPVSSNNFDLGSETSARLIRDLELSVDDVQFNAYSAPLSAIEGVSGPDSSDFPRSFFNQMAGLDSVSGVLKGLVPPFGRPSVGDFTSQIEQQPFVV